MTHANLPFAVEWSRGRLEQTLLLRSPPCSFGSAEEVEWFFLQPAAHFSESARCQTGPVSLTVMAGAGLRRTGRRSGDGHACDSATPRLETPGGRRGAQTSLHGVEVAEDLSIDVRGQIAQMLAQIDAAQEMIESDRTRLLLVRSVDDGVAWCVSGRGCAPPSDTPPGLLRKAPMSPGTKTAEGVPPPPPRGSVPRPKTRHGVKVGPV